VHRFFCENPTCPRKIFTEPLTALAERYARRSNQLREALLTPLDHFWCKLPACYFGLEGSEGTLQTKDGRYDTRD
jgi:hypothetical protein